MVKPETNAAGPEGFPPPSECRIRLATGDPRSRGIQARIARDFLTLQEVWRTGARFLAGGIHSPSQVLAALPSLGEDEEILAICRNVASRADGKVGEADVMAALAADLVGRVLNDPSLGGDCVREMAAILGTTLGPSIRSCHLDMPKTSWSGLDASEDVDRPGSGKSARQEVFEGILLPLANFALISLSHFRLATELLPTELPQEQADRPLGWAPGVDSIWRVMRYALLGQFSSRRFLSKAFLGSAFSRFVQGEHIGLVVQFLSGRCPQCSARASDCRILCPQCGADRVFSLGQRLLGVNYLSTCGIARDGGQPYYFPAEGARRYSEPAAHGAEL